MEKANNVVSMSAYKAKMKNKKFKEVEQIVSQMGLTIKRIANTDEYRVNYKNGREATAYYTNDLEDAYLTAYAMSFHENPYEEASTKLKTVRKLVKNMLTDSK